MTASNPVRRLAAIVDVVASAREGISLQDIGHQVGLPASTTHRSVNILLDIGYVTLDPATKTYAIGDRLKRTLLLTLGTGSLKDIAAPQLSSLSEAFGETAFVVHWTNAGVQLVDYCFPRSGSRTLVHPGYEFPFHASATGKAIFAFQSEAVLETEFRKPIEKFMPATVVDETQIRAELERTRRLGYAANDSELDPGVFSVGAPIYVGDETVMAAIGIAAISERVLAGFSIEELGAATVEAAREISRLLPKSLQD